MSRDIVALDAWHSVLYPVPPQTTVDANSRLRDAHIACEPVTPGDLL